MDILEGHPLFSGEKMSTTSKSSATSMKQHRQRFPVPNCKPYYEEWLRCVDTKDNCCGANKCRFMFTEWQNCHKYSDQVRAYNAKIPRFVKDDRAPGTFNGFSSK
jgi:hypothetical protein